MQPRKSDLLHISKILPAVLKEIANNANKPGAIKPTKERGER